MFRFQFCVFEALQAAGRSELILGQLNRWRNMLDAGLTTFPEHGIESQTDVHPCSAHSLYHSLASTAEVRPTKPGFRSVVIRPEPGMLTALSANVAKPHGQIRIKHTLVGETHGQVDIALRGEIGGTLKWQGVSSALHPGANQVNLRR